MLWILLPILLGLATLPAPVRSQGASPPEAERGAPVHAEVTMVDGTVVRGLVMAETEVAIVIDSPTLGRLSILRERIRSIAYDSEPAEGGSRASWRQDPDYNSLLLVPTPETLPKGDVYYRNFELLFNNFGIALTDEFNVSAMAIFPVTGDVNVFSVGAKLRLLSREAGGVGLAISGSQWFIDDESLSTVSAFAGIGDRRRSLTLAANYGFADGGEEFFFLVGGDVQVGPGFKLLAEYGNSESAISDENDFKGIINLGFRVFWEKVSFSLSGFRPLEETGDFLAFPIAMFSAHF